MGLKAGDLINLVNKVFEIDSFKSKMGNDSDIVVLSFTVSEKAAATDLVEFIERGYHFVLDADISSGEQEDGMYRVFVELERDNNVPDQIMEIINGVEKLTSRNNFRFRYYKGFKSYPVNKETLTVSIPLDNNSYNITVTESNMNNFKNFFNRSFLEEIELEENQELTIKRIWGDPVGFKVKDFGTTESMLESITDKINMNDFAEIIFLTKYIGDYNVTKFGKNTLTFENAGHMLVLERLR